MRFKESVLAHKLLDGLKGIEIGGSAHNQFGLNTINCGHSTDGTAYAVEEKKLCGNVLKVDVECDAGSLPFEDGQWDFVIASHVLEHCYDVIGTLKEWLRVVRPGGYVFVIFPHKERTFDKDRERTKLAELIERHNGYRSEDADQDKHHTVWITDDGFELVKHMGLKLVLLQDVDDKVGNGFTFVVQKDNAPEMLQQEGDAVSPDV